MTPPTITTPPELPIYVDAAEIARRYSVSKRHICDLAANGEIPALRVGAAWRFDPAAVHAVFARPIGRKRPSQTRRKAS